MAGDNIIEKVLSSKFYEVAGDNIIDKVLSSKFSFISGWWQYHWQSRIIQILFYQWPVTAKMMNAILPPWDPRKKPPKDEAPRNFRLANGRKPWDPSVIWTDKRMELFCHMNRQTNGNPQSYELKAKKVMEPVSHNLLTQKRMEPLCHMNCTHKKVMEPVSHMNWQTNELTTQNSEIDESRR